MRRLLPGLKTLDMFGTTPSLTFAGAGAYTTYLGTAVSVLMYVLMIINAY